MEGSGGGAPAAMAAMQEQSFGKGDGLHGKFYPVAGATIGVVIATGIHQHSGMYDTFAKRIQSEGYAVFGYDHRGFGQSVSYVGASRSQISEWLALDKPSATGDCIDAIVLLKKLSGVGKVYLFGHSLGGTIAALVATCPENPAAGFILSNPSLANPWEDAPPEKQEEMKAMDVDAVCGNFDADGASNNQEFKDMWFSEPIAKYIEEGRPFKAAYLLGALGSGIATLRARLGEFRSDAYVIRGGEDIAIYEQNGCADLIRMASKDAFITLVCYPGYKHEIIFEPAGLCMHAGKNKVVDGIVGWLKQQQQ